jgi:hypothetical protein
MMNGYLGNNDEFFRWIAFEPHHAWVPWVRSRTWTAFPSSITKDRRWTDLMRRFNLPMPRAS